MGGSDWAGRMCMKLQEQFNVSDDRALRITTLVRYMLSGEGYEDVFDGHESVRRSKLQEVLIRSLDESLSRQPGNTIEERWNNLMDKLDCPTHADKGVYLVPWEQHDPEDWHSPGTTRTRPV